jgi:hypothetical protein
VNPEVEGIRQLLRALAEVRDGPFYSLWVDMTYRVKQPMPQFVFRIFQVNDGINAVLSVNVSAYRADGAEVSWGVGLNTVDSLNVYGGIEIDDKDGTREVFECSEIAASPKMAAEIIRRFAQEVCAQRHWFDMADAP